MNDVYSLLNLSHETIKDFHLLAKRIDDIQTQRIINYNVRKLHSIEERMLAGGGINVSKQSIDEILYRVVKASESGDTSIEAWTMRELRIISYYLMKLQDEENAFDYALSLLDKGWKNIFLNGLLFYIMNSWCLIAPNLRAKASQLIIRKLQEYNDNNQRYILLKNHANMLEEEGPHRLAYLLISRVKDVREAPLVLGCKSSALSQSYFSDVIIKYCSRKTLDENTLEQIFSVHNEKRTKQLVFADLVQKADDVGDPIKQTQLSNFINRTLGDVTLKNTWAPFMGATYEEAQKLKKAMQQVNLWFTRRIIETFFDVCVQDKERRQFWLDYVSNVKGFKIAGSESTKHILQNDQRIGSMFHHHFIETNSRTSQTSALILNIRDYILVEFSDTGALYAYKENNRNVSFLKRCPKYMTSISELKKPSMCNLVEKDYWGDYEYREEGRLLHSGYWKDRLTAWINFNVMSSANTGISFFAEQDDNTFTAQPLPKQEKIGKYNGIESKHIKDDIKNPTPHSNSISRSDAKNTLSQKPKLKIYIPQPKPELNQKVTPQSKQEPIFNSRLRLSMTPITETRYRRNVGYSKTSKYFFYDNCRVVCNKDGFYVNIYRTKNFVKIRDVIGNIPPGNIWIKSPINDDWTRIVFALTTKEEIVVGYIKMAGGGFIFKQDINQPTYLTIKSR